MEQDRIERLIEEAVDTVVNQMIHKYEEMAGVLLSEKERDALDWVLNQAMNYGHTLTDKINQLTAPSLTVVAIPIDDPIIQEYVMADGNKTAEELERLIRETQKDRKDPNKPAHGDNVGNDNS